MLKHSLPHLTRMLIMIRSTIAVSLLIFLSACATMRSAEVVQPKEITLEQALLSIGCGLKAMDQAQGSFQTGLFPSEVEIKFALSASTTESGKLTLALTDSTGNAKVGGESGQESKGERSNNITIKFTNVLGVNNSTLAGSKSPEEITKLLKALKDAGISMFNRDRINITTGSVYCK